MLISVARDGKSESGVDTSTRQKTKSMRYLYNEMFLNWTCERRF